MINVFTRELNGALASLVKEIDASVAKNKSQNLSAFVVLLADDPDTAQEKEIPFQRMANSRFTGTDTDAFAYSNGGVPSALISLPLRYMHTTVEMVHKTDVENVIKLIYESVLKIKDGDSFSYFD